MEHVAPEEDTVLDAAVQKLEAVPGNDCCPLWLGVSAVEESVVVHSSHSARVLPVGDMVLTLHFAPCWVEAASTSREYAGPG
jgi:hypothetical protein